MVSRYNLKPEGLPPPSDQHSILGVIVTPLGGLGVSAQFGKTGPGGENLYVCPVNGFVLMVVVSVLELTAGLVPEPLIERKLPEPVLIPQMPIDALLLIGDAASCL